MKRILLGLGLVLVLAGCNPLGVTVRDLLDTSDTATLSYVERGLAFDNGEGTALAAILRVRGDNLELISTEFECPIVTAERLDCRLGDVAEVTVVNMTGQNVIGSVSYFRPDDPTPYVAYTR